MADLPRQSQTQVRFRGRQIVVIGLIGAAIGLAAALLLRRLAASTTAQITPSAQFWLLVLLSGFGLLAGLSIEAVRQLQVASPEPEYHQYHRHKRGRGEEPPV